MTAATGITVRAATLDDAPAIRDLINTVDTIELGAPETGTEEVVRELTRPGTAMATDTWLAYAPGGALVAYAVVNDPYGTERVNADHYVLPDHQAAGEHLVDLMTWRATEIAAANGAPEAVVHLYLTTNPVLDTGLLRARGWTTVRRYQVLTRRVAPATDPAPAPPPGVRMRDCADDAARRAVHALMEEAFTRHHDYHPRTFEQWSHAFGPAGPEWSLTWLAHADGIGAAGALVARNDRETMGWVTQLGVAAAARGRGIGSFLLRSAFAEFARLGRDTVGLGVDTENVTGALRLYEGLGMRVHFAADTWELRAATR
ncbi:GNAT family N-acetyltransferase [Streptomyces capparidis]